MSLKPITYQPRVAGSNPAARKLACRSQKLRTSWPKKAQQAPGLRPFLRPFPHTHAQGSERADACSEVWGGAHRPLPFEAVQDVGRSAVSPVSAPILAHWMKGRGGFQREPDPAVPPSAR